jgi:hypothetical protein
MAEPPHCFEPPISFQFCSQLQAVAEPREDDGHFIYYWVRTALGTIDRWSERSSWPKDIRFVRPVKPPTGEVTITWQEQNALIYLLRDRTTSDWMEYLSYVCGLNQAQAEVQTEALEGLFKKLAPSAPKLRRVK